MISVVVPVYNVEKYVIKCLESIVNQSYKDFELLIVNDGSTDNSINLINDYLKDTHINWKIINKENGGLASARNAGIKKSKGEYISFVDSDDYISTDFLETLLANINKGDYDFSFCNYKFIQQQNIDLDFNKEYCEFSKKELLETFLKRTIYFVVPSMMFKKDFLVNNELYFDEEIKFSEDQPFIWNVILHSNKTIYSYSKMYGYFMRENSIMTSSSLDKIKNSYFEFKDYINGLFSTYPEYNNIYKLIMPRWELGALYTSARILTKDEYKTIYDLFEGKEMLKKVKGIGEKKAYALATVCSISCDLMYKFCNKLDLNK